MSDAIIATGILLKAGDGGGPETFVALGEIVSLKPPQLSRNEIEVGVHNTGRDDKILGMYRRGQVTGTLNFVPTDATHKQVISDIKANQKRNWQITYPPDGLPVDSFAARVQMWDVQEATTDAALQVAFALTIDGDITTVEE